MYSLRCFSVSVFRTYCIDLIPNDDKCFECLSRRVYRRHYRQNITRAFTRRSFAFCMRLLAVSKLTVKGESQLVSETYWLSGRDRYQKLRYLVANGAQVHTDRLLFKLPHEDDPDVRHLLVELIPNTAMFRLPLPLAVLVRVTI